MEEDCCFHQCYQRYEIEGDQITRLVSRPGDKRETRVAVKRKTSLGIPRYILEDNIKMHIKVLGVASGYGPVAGSCEHSPELSCCVQCDEFLDQMSDY